MFDNDTFGGGAFSGKASKGASGINSRMAAYGKKRKEEQQVQQQLADIKNPTRPEPVKIKVNVNGKELELDEGTRENWFKLPDKAKMLLKEKYGEKTFNELKSQLEKEAPKQSFFDRNVRDRVSANTEMDKFKRVQQGQDEDYRTAQRAAGEKDYTNPFQRVAFSVAEPVVRGGNTIAGAVGKGAQGISDIAGYVAAGTPEQKKIALERMKRVSEDVAFSKKGGLLGVGTNFDNASELEDKKKLIGTTVQTGADLASVLPTGSAVKTGVTLTGSAVKGRLAKEVASNLVTGLGSEGGRQLKEGKFDAKALAINAAMDVATPVGAFAGGRLLKGGAPGSTGKTGIIDAANDKVSKAFKNTGYKVSDVLRKTSIGSSVLDAKDKFANSVIDSLSPVYREFKRSDAEGRSKGFYDESRRLAGDVKRSQSESMAYLNNNENMKALIGGVASKGKRLDNAMADADEYIRLESELERVNAGIKDFSPEKLADIARRKADFESKFGTKAFEEEYQALKRLYQDYNDLRLENNTLSPELHAEYKNAPFDYTRAQRELSEASEQTMKSAPGMNTTKATASLTKSAVDKRVKKKAEGELLSPIQTAIATSQLIHHEIAQNKAAKRLSEMLGEVGGAKVIRSSDMVLQKRALLEELRDTKPLAKDLERLLSQNKKQASQIAREMNALKKTGRDEFSKEINKLAKEFNTTAALKPDVPLSPKAVIEMISSMDNVQLRKVRRMLEARDAKLNPLLDKIELVSRDLNDIHAQRQGTWYAANGIKTGVNKTGKGTISFLDKGIENVVEMDPKIAAGLKNWDAVNRGMMNGVLRSYNNLFKFGTTGGNLAFAGPNVVADLIGGAINSKAFFSIYMNPVNYANTITSTLGFPMTKAEKAAFEFYQQGNKRQLMVNMYSKPKSSEKVAREMIKQKGPISKRLYTDITNPKELLREVSNFADATVGKSEEFTRYLNFRGTYKKALKNGTPENARQLANQAARENSVDFLAGGNHVIVANSLYPYLNAGIQGSRTLLRTASERPLSFAAKITALVGAPTAITTANNLSSPEKKAIYDDIDPWIKENNFVWIKDGAKWNAEKNKYEGVILIKKVPGAKAFADPIREFMEFKANTDPNASKGFLDFLKQEGGNIAKDTVADLTPVDPSDKWKVLNSITPQGAKPFAEGVTNKSFYTGQDIIPEYTVVDGERVKTSSLPPELQRKENYSASSSAIGKFFKTSPLVVDNYIKQTFGELGTNAQNSIDQISGAPKEAQGGRTLGESISRRFTGATGGASTDAFYKSYSPAFDAKNRVNTKISSLIEKGRTEEARMIANEFNDSLKKRFEPFFIKYADTPNYDPEWDKKLEDLFIITTPAAFKRRQYAIKKRLEEEARYGQ